MNLQFEELTATDGARLGIATLDAEKALNALSLPMILALQDRLKSATTPKDVMDAQAAIDNETAWTHNATASLQAIQVNYQAQADARVQRDNESISQSFDQFHEKASVLAWPK